MSIWSFQRVLSQRLLAWNILNFTGGLIFLLSSSKFFQGLGSQFAGWAIVNAAIAIFGQTSAENRHLRLPDADTPERRIREAGNLRAILWVNAALDVLYVIGGVRLFTRKKSGERLRGIGLGIVFQGIFLFIFDLIHTQNVPDQSQQS